jgi:hypothetical protein
MSKQKQSILILLSLFILPVLGTAQVPFPLNHSLNLQLENQLYNRKDITFTSLKPLHPYDIAKGYDLDSLLYPDIYRNFNPRNRSWFNRKLLYEDFYVKDSTNIRMEINPAINLSGLKNTTGNKDLLYTNTRAVRAHANFMDRVYVTTMFYENQKFFPDYLNQFYKNYRVIPGYGWAKSFKQGGRDYYWASGQLAYRPDENNTLVAGHGKQFVGNGYRSMLLSDVPYQFPHIQYMYKDKNLQYSKTVALLKSRLDIENPVRPGEEKTGVFHYVAAGIGNHLELGLFEGTIVNNPDSSGNYSFYAGYVNPMPLLNSLLPFNNMETHSLVGLNVHYKPTHAFSLYGQLALDQPFKKSNGIPQSDKWSGQLGIKLFEPFQINNLIINSEFNLAAPSSYGDMDPKLSYTHYHQPLAHVQGGNFAELVNILHYRKNRFSIQAEMLWSQYGNTSVNIHSGKHIQLSDEYFTQQNESSQFLQGDIARLRLFEVQLGWLINPAYDMKLFAGYRLREETIQETSTSNAFISFGIKTSLLNTYYDF